MTDFEDGDEVLGKYGLHFTRRGGMWYSDTGSESTDDTMEFLLSLNNLPKIKPKPVVSKKISKSEKYTAPGFEYQFTHRRT